MSRVNDIREVIEDPLFGRIIVTPRSERTGTTAHLPASAVLTDTLIELQVTMTFPPRLGEHNESILAPLGYDVAGLRQREVI